MKAVMISIRPKWCELIASGRKTIEVRKTKPRVVPPFKCYIYCTKPSNEIIGEFTCDQICKVVSMPDIFAWHPCYHEKAIKDACIAMKEVEKYSGGKQLFGWHISNLKIYEKPRKLEEFCVDRDVETDSPQFTGMKRPPQSWCYVKENTDVNVVS